MTFPMQPLSSPLNPISTVTTHSIKSTFIQFLIEPLSSSHGTLGFCETHLEMLVWAIQQQPPINHPSSGTRLKLGSMVFNFPGSISNVSTTLNQCLNYLQWRRGTSCGIRRRYCVKNKPCNKSLHIWNHSTCTRIPVRIKLYTKWFLYGYNCSISHVYCLNSQNQSK